MKKQLVILLTCLTFGFVAQSQQAYVFFLHNKFLEEAGIEGVHPEYGRAQYKEIISAFEKEKFTVISDLRPKNTDAIAYAKKVVKQIDNLISKGIKASQITVVGTSKGGYIAMYVSTYLKNADVNFIFIGCCSENVPNSPFNFCGRILSIYEKSDDIGRSCSQLKQSSTNKISAYKEIEINTSLRHGFLYKPLKDWLNPCFDWIRQ